MKVFMICNCPLDGKNAQTTHVSELFKNLSRLSEVILFAPKPKNNINIRNEKNIVFIPTVSINKFNYLVYEIFLFLFLMYYCLKQKSDVIYVRYSSVLYSYMIISKIFRIPFIIEINGIPSEEFKITRHYKGIFTKVASTVFTALSEKLNYKYAKKIVAVSSGIKKYIVKNYNINPFNVSVIQNGANIDLFKPLNQNKIKKEMGFDLNCNYIGFCGSFNSWHGLKQLVKSAPLILEKSKNVKFQLIGNGIIKEEICQMVNDFHLSDSFIFINAVPYEEIPKYVNAFDIGVILKEKNISGSPLKLWEYMACGVPVVATNSDDFYLLKKYNGGLIVDSEKPDEIAEAILSLLKNKKLREEMGKNARKYVIKNNSWETVANRVKKVCEDAIKKDG